MIMHYILYIILCICSSWLYRRGGSDKSYHGKERDLGVSLCLIACLWLFKGWTWLYIPVFGLSWVSLSMYHKWLNPFFDKPKSDCFWFNWTTHGQGIGYAVMPLVFLPSISLSSILARVVFLAISMTLVSEYSENVEYEENMRGFLACASIVFLI